MILVGRNLVRFVERIECDFDEGFRVLFVAAYENVDT